MMSLLERTKSNFFWGGCGMNVGEWRFVVIFNLFSNVSGCHKIAEFICECPQSFDIFKRHVSKYFFFLVGGFNLTFKVKFCQKLKVRKNSSHMFCCFPKFLLRHQRTCKFEWFSTALVAENQQKVFVVDLWIWNLAPLFNGTGTFRGELWMCLSIFRALQKCAGSGRFYRAVFFFSVRFRCLFGNDCKNWDLFATSCGTWMK